MNTNSFLRFVGLMRRDFCLKIKPVAAAHGSDLKKTCTTRQPYVAYSSLIRTSTKPNTKHLNHGLRKDTGWQVTRKAL